MRSVEMQKNSDVEYIIIDGGSIDGSLGVISSNSSIIDLWVSEEDSGISNAFNKGVSKATGEYVLFLNADDFLGDDFISKFIDFYRNSPISDVYYSDLQSISSGLVTKAVVPCHNDLGWKMSLYHPSTIVRRSLLQKYKFDESYKVAMDYRLFLKLCSMNTSFQYFVSNGVFFQRGGVSTGSKKNILKGYLEMLRAQADCSSLSLRGVLYILSLSLSLYLGPARFSKIHKILVLPLRLIKKILTTLSSV